MNGGLEKLLHPYPKPFINNIQKRATFVWGIIGFTSVRPHRSPSRVMLATTSGITKDADYTKLSAKVDNSFDLMNSIADMNRGQHNLAMAMRRRESNRIAENMSTVASVGASALAGAAVSMVPGGMALAPTVMSAVQSSTKRGLNLATQQAEKSSIETEGELGIKKSQAISDFLKTGKTSVLKKHKSYANKERNRQHKEDLKYKMSAQDVQKFMDEGTILGKAGVEVGRLAAEAAARTAGDAVQGVSSLVGQVRDLKDRQKLSNMKKAPTPPLPTSSSSRPGPRGGRRHARVATEQQRIQALERAEALTKKKDLVKDYRKTSSMQYSCENARICRGDPANFTGKLRPNVEHEAPFYAKTPEEARNHCCEPQTADERAQHQIAQEEKTSKAALHRVQRQRKVLDTQAALRSEQSELNAQRLRVEGDEETERCMDIVAGDLTQPAEEVQRCGSKLGEAFWREHETRLKTRYKTKNKERLSSVIRSQKMGREPDREVIGLLTGSSSPSPYASYSFRPKRRLTGSSDHESSANALTRSLGGGFDEADPIRLLTSKHPNRTAAHMRRAMADNPKRAFRLAQSLVPHLRDSPKFCRRAAALVRDGLGPTILARPFIRIATIAQRVGTVPEKAHQRLVRDMQRLAKKIS